MNSKSVTNNGSRNRQADFRRRMEAAGYVQVTGWVHRDQAADALTMLRRLRENPALSPVSLRNSATNKFEGLN
ncbi:hypothetical protein ACFOOL_14290 [Devosia honganensis]|uniref:Uncharacterized protein n=1 Tax=Devosia honganensis TaxID=1610527 RepID=A0ABV7X3F2_9HYPH